MMLRVRPARRCTAAVLFTALFVAACSGDDDGGPEAPETVADTEFTEVDVDFTESSDGTQDADDDGFDPTVVDEELVPETVDEIVLDDDVIIATEDGAIPTTTTEPPPPAEDAVQPADVTTTIAPVPLPDVEDVRRVISLSPTHTDTMAALGAADLLVGVDGDSDVPAGTSSIVVADLVPDDLLLDDLRALDPDVILVGDDPDGTVSQGLAELGIPVLDGARPDSRAGVEAQILAVARLVGRDDAGEQLVATMRADVEAIVATLPGTDGLTYFHEIDPGFATYRPGSLVDSLYAELGLTSIVPPADGDIAFLTPDQVVTGDPDVVVLADIDCCASTIARAAARSGWSDVSAIQNGAIVEVPDQLALRWGTNIVELMRRVAVAVVAAS